MAMSEAMAAGLKKWAKDRKTRTIAEHLAGKPNVSDPRALAVWVRKQALGEEGFRAHQRMARKK